MMKCLVFFQQDLYKSILRGGNSNPDNIFSGASANFVAGAAAGCISLILVYPLDIAHTCLAADIGRTEVRQFHVNTVKRKGAKFQPNSQLFAKSLVIHFHPAYQLLLML